MKRLIALILTLLLIPLNACLPQEEPVRESAYGLWFATRSDSGREDHSAVAREERQWVQDPTAEELMAALLNGPEKVGLYLPFPDGTTVRSITVDAERQIAHVDMSEQYGTLSGFELTLADYCIALTLCQLPQVKLVRVMVEGSSIPDRNRQKLQPGDVLLSGISEEPSAFLAALYFPSRAGSSLTTEYRQVTRSGSSKPMEIVMAELLRGPSDGEGSYAMPEGTQVFSLAVDDGVCRVDLSREFVINAPKDEAQAGLTLYAMVNTLCALAGISQIQLLIEGEIVESYGGVSVNTPISANFDLASN